MLCIWLSGDHIAMNIRLIGNVIGAILWVLGLFLLLPLAISLLYHDGAWGSFVPVIALCGVLGFALRRIPVQKKQMQGRDGYVAVALCWVILAIFGCLPYLLSGSLHSFADAVFETASGITTTGASIVTDVERLCPSIQFWRSLTQWMGGMGVLVLFLALMPKLGDGAVYLMRAESPGPIKSKLVPKVSQSAKILYAIYIGLTAAEVIALLLTGMPLFDAVNHAFTTMATGGFSIRSSGVGSYGTAAIWVITAFTFLAGANFSVLFAAIRGRWREVLHSEELRLYACLVAVSSVLIVGNLLLETETTVGQAFTDAIFQVVTLVTTTGYATADFALWPSFSCAILLLLMVTGACAGSTAGGVKLGRIQILYRNFRRELRKILHPNHISTITIDGMPVEERVISGAGAFLVAYCLIAVLGTVVVSWDNVGLLESISAAVTCISNVGPGLGALGPMANFSVLSDGSKFVLSLIMLMGRLELMPLLVLFSRHTWKHS